MQRLERGTSMATRISVFASSVGTKVLIALTGLALVGFLVMHLAGNLLYFVGPDTYNEYSHKLITNPLLIPAELGLLVIFIAHIFKAVKMFIDNRRARPVGYYQKQWAGTPSRKSVASSTMIYSGLITLAFVVLHLKTFKYGTHYLANNSDARDLHRLMSEVFAQPLYVAFYVICLVLIGFHLAHGVSSAFQSLGVDHPRYSKRLRLGGRVLAVAIGGGFALIPLAIFLFGGRS